MDTEKMHDTNQLPLFDGRAAVSWLGSDTDAPAPATPALLDSELYLAPPCRTGNRYPRQRNYHGHYYFSKTGKHVWHESLLEANMLMLLDWRDDIVAIASQPLQFTFSDGSIHFPDFLALHANQRQVMYDVKPLDLVTGSVTEQFAKTRAVCEAVGWGYEVLTGLPEQEQSNLTWLNYFKNGLFHPGSSAERRLRSALDAGPLGLLEASASLALDSLAEGRSALYHLLWTRTVRVAMTTPLSDNSLVEWNTNV